MVFLLINGFVWSDVALGFKGLPYGRIVISQSNAGSPLTDQIRSFFFGEEAGAKSDIIFAIPVHTFLVVEIVLF